MLPTSFTTCLIATAIPESIRLHAVVDLLHDHRQHMNLDSHLETKTRLAAHVITFHSADSDADLFIPDGLDRWLVSATEDIVAGLEVEENQIPDKGWSVEYWSVEIAHPMGKSFGKLRYTASFVNTVDGVVIIVHVGGVLGFKSWTRYRVQTLANGQKAALIEDARLQCPLGFGGFTKKEIERSHPEAHQKIMQHLTQIS